MSYPHIWALFYEVDLKIKTSLNSSCAVWSNKSSYTEVSIQAPDTVQLWCSIEHNHNKIEIESLAQFNNDRKKL